MSKLVVLVFFKTAISIDPLRSYCDETAPTDTSNFLPFGSSAWPHPSNQLNNSMWVDTRDEWILEEDDSYHEIDFSAFFGGQYFEKMCISSNGPVYMGSCDLYDLYPDYDAEGINPLANEHWTGISAYWADMLQATDFTARHGGNVYYRHVQLSDGTEEAINDLVMITNRLGSTEAVTNAHIITFHKMAEQNHKRPCNLGVSFQYVIVPRPSNDNPLVYLAFGEFQWQLQSPTVGWNAYATPNNYGFNLITDPRGVGDAANLPRQSFTCDGSTGCWVVHCEETLVFDVANSVSRCTITEEAPTDSVELSLDVAIQLNNTCDPNTMTEQLSEINPQIHAFLEYVYQWSNLHEVLLAEVACREITTNELDDQGNFKVENYVEIILTGTIKRIITSGLLDDFEAARELLEEILLQELTTPLSAIDLYEMSNIIPEELVDTILEDISDITAASEVTLSELICGEGHFLGPSGCDDIDECEQDLASICGPAAVSCEDQDFGYSCSCPTGYESIPDTNSTFYNADFPEYGPYICEEIGEAIFLDPVELVAEILTSKFSFGIEIDAQ